MKCIFAAALLVSLITFSSAFAQEGPSGASVADREWRSLVEPLLPLGERTAALVSDPQDPLLRQEMYKQLFMSMSAAYLGLFVGDAAHPDFWPVFNQAYPLGSANPDDAYYLATLGGDGVQNFRLSRHGAHHRFPDRHRWMVRRGQPLCTGACQLRH